MWPKSHKSHACVLWFLPMTAILENVGCLVAVWALRMGQALRFSVFAVAPALLDKRDIRHRDELELSSAFVEHQRAAIFGDQAVLRLFDPHDITTVKSKSVGNEGS